MSETVNEENQLAGQIVMVTRPCGDDDSLGKRLGELGARVLHQPVICISDPPDWGPVDGALNRLAEFDWIVFSSANGVRYFLGRGMEKGTGPICAKRPSGRSGKLDLSPFPRLAAIGPATADAVLRHGMTADVVPPEFRAESLAESLSGQASGKRFLLVRASRGREVLAEQLTAAGGIVEQVVAYTSSDVERADPEIEKMLAAGEIDWITVTSSSIARAIVNLFGEKLRQSKLASISPVTSVVLRELGFEPTVEAAQYTMVGLIEAILRRLG
jgi:uroporphyrinogen III methyltransferase / synthase